MESLCEVLAMTGDLTAQRISTAWLSIRSQDSGGAPETTGLRSPVKLEIRGRYTTHIIRGRYIRRGPRLIYVEDARDPDDNRRDIVITGSALIGEPAVYRPKNGEPRPCRVFVNYLAPTIDDYGQTTDYRISAEVAIIETGRIQPYEQLEIAGITYDVTGYRGDTDDGVVRGLWLDRPR